MFKGSIKELEVVTGKNVDQIKLDKVISELGHDALNFEGMPRMIFDNE